MFGRLTSQIRAKAAAIKRISTAETALARLSQQPAPSVILVADGAITRNNKVYKRAVDRLREGATVILAGCFSGFVTQGKFGHFFARLDLPWRRGSYHRATVCFRPGAADTIRGANRLPASYSQKPLFAKNIERSAAWCTEESSDKAAVA